MAGEELLRQLIAATGLPDHLIEKEMQRLIERSGLSASELDMDSIRAILTEYLQDTLVEAKKHFQNQTA